MNSHQYSTQLYNIDVDIIKNRIVIKPIGFWRSSKNVPNYLATIFHAVDQRLRPKFMIIFDVSEMLTHPLEVQENIHSYGIQQLLNRKPAASVVVIPRDDIAQMQTNFLSKATGLPVKSFVTVEDAHQFLDEYAIKKGLM